ncbi:MAG: acyl-CoA thioesterase [Calditrichaeota bacterium]|nr:acyl-CoA thioesterase [Calditrichota bacterium]
MQSFQTKLTVRVGDMNYGGHLANDKTLLYFHEARIRYFRELGITEGNIGDDVALTQTEAYINYTGEAFCGDELLIKVQIDNITRARFKVNYEITRIGDEKSIATGYTVLAGFDYSSKKLKRIPQSFRDKVTKFQDV